MKRINQSEPTQKQVGNFMPGTPDAARASGNFGTCRALNYSPTYIPFYSICVTSGLILVNLRPILQNSLDLSGEAIWTMR